MATETKAEPPKPKPIPTPEEAKLYSLEVIVTEEDLNAENRMKLLTDEQLEKIQKTHATNTETKRRQILNHYLLSKVRYNFNFFGLWCSTGFTPNQILRILEENRTEVMSGASSTLPIPVGTVDEMIRQRDEREAKTRIAEMRIEAEKITFIGLPSVDGSSPDEVMTGWKETGGGPLRYGTPQEGRPMPRSYLVLGGQKPSILGDTEKKGCELGVLSYFNLIDRYDAENILDVEDAYEWAFGFPTIISYINTILRVPVREIRYQLDTIVQLQNLFELLLSSLKNGEHIIALFHRPLRPTVLHHVAILAKHDDKLYTVDPQLIKRDLPGTNSESVRRTWPIEPLKLQRLFQSWKKTGWLIVSLPAYEGDVVPFDFRPNCRSLAVDPLRYAKNCDPTVLNLYHSLVEEKDNTDCPEEASKKKSRLDAYERICRNQTLAVDNIIDADRLIIRKYFELSGELKHYKSRFIVIRGQTYSYTREYRAVLNFNPRVGLTINTPSRETLDPIVPMVIPPHPNQDRQLFLIQKDFNSYLRCSRYQHTGNNCVLIALHDAGFISKTEGERLHQALNAQLALYEQDYLTRGGSATIPFPKSRGISLFEIWGIFRAILDINEYPYIFGVEFDLENFKSLVLENDAILYRGNVIILCIGCSPSHPLRPIRNPRATEWNHTTIVHKDMNGVLNVYDRQITGGSISPLLYDIYIREINNNADSPINLVNAWFSIADYSVLKNITL